MKYIGENAIKKLISLIKGDLATKQDSIAATGVLERDTTGVINGVETVGATLVETQEATLVDVPNGLLKGDGTTISAAVAGTDYVNSSQAIRYDAAQTLTDAQKTQARNNISAMQGIESTDHPGCYYVLNDSAVEWINPPMLNNVDYATIERYMGKPVHRGLLGDFEAWGYIGGPGWISAGKPITYMLDAGGTKNINLYTSRSFIFSSSDNARAGVAIVQCTNGGIRAVTPLVSFVNWKIEAGSGLSVNVTETSGEYNMAFDAMML